jgi:hypothetical protein
MSNRHEKDSVTSINVVAMKRYNYVKSVKITGIENINEFLDNIYYNNLLVIDQILKKEGLVLGSSNQVNFKHDGIELIQINQTINSKDEVIAICLIGIINNLSITPLHGELYRYGGDCEK